MRMEQFRDKEEKAVVQKRMMYMSPSVEHEAKSWNKEIPAEMEFENKNVYELISAFVNAKSKKKRRQ